MRPLKIENSIHIKASNNLVWEVVEDIERWPEWTPTITSIRFLDKGQFGLGTRVKIKQPGQPESIWTVIEYVRGERFAWETHRFGLQLMAIHQLEQKENGTLNTLQVKATGFLAIVFRLVLKIAIRRALMSENKGLKIRCEEI